MFISSLWDKKNKQANNQNTLLKGMLERIHFYSHSHHIEIIEKWLLPDILEPISINYFPYYDFKVPYLFYMVLKKIIKKSLLIFVLFLLHKAPYKSLWTGSFNFTSSVELKLKMLLSKTVSLC